MKMKYPVVVVVVICSIVVLSVIIVYQTLPIPTCISNLVIVPPTNQTIFEGKKVKFTCTPSSVSGKVTVRWLREEVPIEEVTALKTRVTIQDNGSLLIHPVLADDFGQYYCIVSDSVCQSKSTAAYLDVQYPAKVVYTPESLFFQQGQPAILPCHIKSNPPISYLVWTKGKEMMPGPQQTKDFTILEDGTLRFNKLEQKHEGQYKCTAYNEFGTQGSSRNINVFICEPLVFTVEPFVMYLRKIGESVEIQCNAKELNGTAKPKLHWKKQDTDFPLTSGGNLNITNITESDFGMYECTATNNLASIVTTTQLVNESTPRYLPYTVTAKPLEKSVELAWRPEYSGSANREEEYVVSYAQEGVVRSYITAVRPPGTRNVTIKRLMPDTMYEFYIVRKGFHTPSETFKFKTTSIKYFYAPETPDPLGRPQNLMIAITDEGFLLTWENHDADLINSYTVQYRTTGEWKILNTHHIKAEATSYLVLVKHLPAGRYTIRVLSDLNPGYETSDEVEVIMPTRIK